MKGHSGVRRREGLLGRRGVVKNVKWVSSATFIIGKEHRGRLRVWSRNRTPITMGLRVKSASTNPTFFSDDVTIYFIKHFHDTTCSSRCYVIVGLLQNISRFCTEIQIIPSAAKGYFRSFRVLCNTNYDGS